MARSSEAITEAEVEARTKALMAEADKWRVRDFRAQAVDQLVVEKARPRQRAEKCDQMRAERYSLVCDVWPDALAAFGYPLDTGPIYYVRWPFELDSSAVYAKRTSPGGGIERKKMATPFLINSASGTRLAAVLDGKEWNVIELSPIYKDTVAALTEAGVVFSTECFVTSGQPGIIGGKQPVPVVTYLEQYIIALRSDS